jgi:WD40 repeat protein
LQILKNLLKPLAKKILEKNFGREIQLAASFSAAGDTVGAVGDGMVHVWDTKTKKNLLIDEQTGSIHCLAFYTKEKVLAVGNSQGNVATYNLENKKRNAFPVNVADIPAFSVICLAISPDEKILVVGGGNRKENTGKVLFLHSATGKMLGQLGAPKMVKEVTVSPDGKWLVVRPDGQNDEFYDWKTKKELSPVKGLKQILLSRFSTDGKRMYASSEEGLGIWELDSGNKLATVELPSKSRIHASTGDLKTVALAGNEGNYFLQFWDVETNKLAWTLMGSQVYITSVVFSPDGKMLALCGLTAEPEKSEVPVPGPTSVVPLPLLEWFIGGAAFLAVLAAGHFLYRRKGPNQNHKKT